MSDRNTNTLADTAGSVDRARGHGEVPEAVKRRYYTSRGGGAGLGYFVDATIQAAAFRDHGRRLVTRHNDPNVIRDLVAIARHREWTSVSVHGDPAFRREAWLAARAAGLEVRGHRPTERDLQELARRQERSGRPPFKDANAQGHLRVVEAVVRGRVAEPSAQDALMQAARRRIADWLERGASFDPVRRPPDRSRTRAR